MPDRPARSRAQLNIEPLEDRTTPAQFGNPWADPTHLTLSFAPDGTRVLGTASNLRAALNHSMAPTVWQSAILRAVEAWSQVSNIDVGVVVDGGQRFGVTAAAQGDPRFGDIRVGGIAMAGDALAAAVPPDPFIVGSMAGDLFINTRRHFTSQSLYRVALHEVGHALGLAPSTDPASVMFNTFNGNVVLSASDIAAIRALYGSRAPDANEGSNGNDSIDRATRVHDPAGYQGFTPLVGYGDISTFSDVDMFEVHNLNAYTGPISFRLQTSGVSMLAARMVVMNGNGTILATATGSGDAGSVLTVSLPHSIADGKYFVRVTGAPAALAGIGRYGLGVTFNGVLQPTAIALGQVLRGPYETLDDDDIQELFTNPDASFYNDDHSGDDTPALAGALAPLPGFPDNSRYAVTASLASATDADFYAIRAPQSDSGTVVLTAVVRAVGPNGSTPRIHALRVLDPATMTFEPVAATILANGNGTFAVQAVGVPANADYVLRVGDSPAPGNYALEASFLTRAADVKTFSSATVDTGSKMRSSLFVARSQVFGFGLSATGPAGASVKFELINSAGNTVFALTAAAGDTVTATTPLIAPGKYRLRVTATGPAGSIQLVLSGGVITDPIGPQPVNSTSAPQYRDPTQPNTYLYPTAPSPTQTTDPFLFLPWFQV